MIRRLCWGVVCALLVIGGLASSAMASVGDNTVAQSVLNVKVYIIAVDGVGGHVV